MIATIHQPHFLPWIGYLERVSKADIFILLDHVQYEHQNFQNRVRIKNGSGAQWITVPLRQTSHAESIREKRVCHENLFWPRNIGRTLEAIYGRTPYFTIYAAALAEIFAFRWEKLVDLNRKTIEFMKEAFEIKTPIVHSSEFKVEGQKTEMAIELCRAVGADVLLCGIGGSRHYLDVDALSKAGIQVRWQEFRHPRYVQQPSPETFIEGLSGLDMLFNCGPGSAALLRGAAPVSDILETAGPEPSTGVVHAS